MIGTEIYVVDDKTVRRWRLQCCQMAVTSCQGLVRLFPLTWQCRHLIIASIIVFIIQQRTTLIPGMEYGRANPRLNASLLQCILGSGRTFSAGGDGGGRPPERPAQLAHVGGPSSFLIGIPRRS